MTMDATTASIEVLAFRTEPEDMLASEADGILGSVVLVSKTLSVKTIRELTCGSATESSTSALRRRAGLWGVN